MKINEIFKGIQGEGKYAGVPSLFVRLSGCNRNCSFCDTNHKSYVEYTSNELITEIKDKTKDLEWVIFTGGEPLMQYKELKPVIQSLNNDYFIAIETNGDYLVDLLKEDLNIDYLSISPKSLKVAEFFSRFSNDDVEIKVVTDLKLNKNMLKYATMLMPLTTFNKKNDLLIKQKVWDYCLKHNIKYSPRLHTDLWGKKKGK